METWGTLSTIDHRTSVLKKSLVLFDRLVVPVPDKPIYDISQEELDELNANISFLENNGAAIPYTWDTEKFDTWRQKAIRESLSVGRGDSLYDSRMMLADSVECLSEKRKVKAYGVPVYGSRIDFNERTSGIAKITESLLVGILKNILLPDDSCSLESIVDLRSKQSFQVALKNYREWQNKILPQLFLEDSEKRVRQAISDFEGMIENYERVMKDHLKKRKRDFVVSVLAIGGSIMAAFESKNPIPLLVASTPALFSLDNLREPAWRLPQDSKYAPAGVIYEAKQHLNNI
jgi:hypothetical protein